MRSTSKNFACILGRVSTACNFIEITVYVYQTLAVWSRPGGKENDKLVREKLLLGAICLPHSLLGFIALPRPSGVGAIVLH